MGNNQAELFNVEWAAAAFPAQRTDDFFAALFGGAEEGAYDIDLSFEEEGDNMLEFAFNLRQRPGKCLACNLTYGLPQVFARHPVLNVKGVVEAIGQKTGRGIVKWELKSTREVSSGWHQIPLSIWLA